MNRPFHLPPPVLLLLPALLLAGCAEFLADERPPPTPLELQAMQSRSYDDRQYDTVFASVLSVFQDLGYIVSAAEKDTGLITAKSATSDDTSLFQALEGTSAMKSTAATAYIESIGSSVRVRLTIVNRRKSSSELGQVFENDRVVLDPQVYQNAFERIENAIFVRESHR